jgi:hypothetical protein
MSRLGGTSARSCRHSRKDFTGPGRGTRAKRRFLPAAFGEGWFRLGVWLLVYTFRIAGSVKAHEAENHHLLVPESAYRRQRGLL